MVVFNNNTIFQLIIVAIPAGIAYGIGSLMDGDSERWAIYTGLVFLMLVDALWRFAAMGDGVEEDEDGNEHPVEGQGPLALVMPGGGGHIMFLPNWLVGGLLFHATFTGIMK
jgi:hypothetical protein